MKRRDQLKTIAQLYKFEDGFEVWITIRYVPGQSREEAVQALGELAHRQAEMTWARYHDFPLNQLCPPGHLVGEVIDIDRNGNLLNPPWATI